MDEKYLEMADSDIEATISIALLQSKRFLDESHPDFDGETCVSCGEDIIPERIAMGRFRCVHCQEAVERGNKYLRIKK